MLIILPNYSRQLNVEMTYVCSENTGPGNGKRDTRDTSSNSKHGIVSMEHSSSDRFERHVATERVVLGERCVVAFVPEAIGCAAAAGKIFDETGTLIGRENHSDRGVHRASSEREMGRRVEKEGGGRLS